MSALLFALALFAQDAGPAAAAKDAAPLAEDMPWPAGAPRDDYGLVSWCHGALTGYLDLHDQVMPEVTRIETTFRSPNSSLKEDLKVYADMQKQSRKDLALFARAMEAAERASIKPINTIGAAAVKKGMGVWAAAPNLPKARVAQEWMSWSLPVRCEPTAERLEKRAKLMGVAFDPSAEAIAAEPASTETPAAPAGDPSIIN